MSSGRPTLGWTGTGYGFPTTTGHGTTSYTSGTAGQGTTTAAPSGYEANTTRRRARNPSPYSYRSATRDTTRPLQYGTDYSYLSHDFSELPGRSSVSFADEPVSWRSERRARGAGTTRSSTLDYLYNNSRRFDGVDYADDSARPVGGFSSNYHTSRQHEDDEYSYASGGRTADVGYPYGSSSGRYGTGSGTGGGGYYSSGARRSREVYGDTGETYGESGMYGTGTYGTDLYGSGTYGSGTYGSGTYGSSSSRYRSRRR